MFLGSPYDGICIGLKTCVQGFVWVNIYPWCILCQGHGYLANCEHSYCRDFYSPLGERGEEKIENPDLPVVFYADICRVMISGLKSSSHVFYALVIIL